MLKKISLILAVLCFYNASLIYAADKIPCDPLLRKYVNAIQAVPEAQKLIEDIQREGAFTVILNNHALSERFGAFWDPDRRCICVSLGAHETEGRIIGSIVFEMHNAAVNQQFEYYDSLASTGQIDKESYVETIEYIEYTNSLKASALAEKGIALGVFPETARLPTYANFDEHYYYQKLGGHSAWIARTFDMISPKK